MILVDHQIREMSLSPTFPNGPLLEPFSEGIQGDGAVSFGVTSAGYDLRIGTKVLVFKNSYNEIVDPRRFKEPGYAKRIFDEIDNLAYGERIIIPAHSYILAYTLEYIRMPTNLKAHVSGKSTYARCGLVLNTTALEPGWEGSLTLEIANASPCPVAVVAGQGIGQLEFHVLPSIPEKHYGNKCEGGAGKYQSQGFAPIPARVKE